MDFLNKIDKIINNIDNTVNLSKFAILKLYVNKENEELINLYTQHVEKHNETILNSTHPNSGFDIFIPNENIFSMENQTEMINLEIKCEMIYRERKNVVNRCGFFIFPRSSMSKTPLILANHTGVIDQGYRGFLMGAFKCFGSPNYVVEKQTRLLQICHATLCPIFVKLVSEESLSVTSRGDGGFGSTGVVGI